MAAKKTKRSFGKRQINVGSSPNQSRGLGYLKINEGPPQDITILAPMDEVVSVEQFAIWDIRPAPIWVSIGDDDPGYELDLKPSYRAFVPVAVVSDDGETEVKIWSIGRGLHSELCNFEDMSGPLKDQVVRVKRTGSGLATRYSIMMNAKGKPLSVEAGDRPTADDIIEMLGPETREEIISLIEDRADMSYADVLINAGVSTSGSNDDEGEGDDVFGDSF